MSRILVVDDDTELRENLTEILKNDGYEVLSADRSEKAIELLDDEPVDLILLDLIMPGMGGMDAIPLFQRTCPGARIIVITAFSTVGNAVESMKKGANDYIAKPFKIDELLTTVRKNLEEGRFLSCKLFLDMDDTFSSLANITRRKVLYILAQEGTVRFMDLARKLEMPDHTKMNFHLKVLRENGLIEQDKKKSYMLSPVGRQVKECLDFIVKNLTS
ncbi:MAG: response regulator [Deltaproteobacteria bacterium]|nr:response regulator [Deltaproteobacteria bacterium]